LEASEIDRWNEAQAIFDTVLESPGEKSLKAARRRAAKTGCTVELEALLAAMNSVSALDLPLDEAIGQMSAERLQPGALSGRVFGRWTLGEEIGRGGMSTVYHAQRTGDGFEQHAALKILSLTFASQPLIYSFLRERQILSELQHPGIARLIDGGVTPEGSPFLVMDFVNGKRIDYWCAENQPDTATRVRMVLHLAEAVAYAQQHLVIHRDINASNVLVNERGLPVLIDFGIAGLLGGDSGQTLQAFTPSFAAPEQIAGKSSTTATDVYAMGRLLQSLLAKKSIDSDLKLLIEVATADDPGQRYTNASSLADDLQAWLDQRPMRARPPSVRYRASRFIARHRWGVAASILLMLSVFAGLASSLWQARIAASERDLAQAESARANQVTVFLKDLFRASDPDEAQGEVLMARDLLDQGAHRVRNTFESSPELKVEMLILLGELYRELDELKPAEPLLRDANTLAESLGDAKLQFESLRALALWEMSSQSHEQALALAEQAEQMLEIGDGIPGLRHSRLLHPILFSLAEMGRADEAVARGEAALQLARSHAGLPPEALYNYLYELANVLVVAQRESAAELLLLEAIDLGLESQKNPTIQIAVLSNLASIYDRKGDIDTSLDYMRQALAISDQIFPLNHSSRARNLSNLASSLNKFGDYQKAEQAAREALDIYLVIYGDKAHPRVAAAHNNLGRALTLQGNYADAIVQIAAARDMAGQLFGEQDPRYSISTGNLGDLLRRAGELDQADELLSLNLEMRLASLGPDHRNVGNSLGVLALLRLDQGRYVEALELTDEALALYKRIDLQDPVWLIITGVRHARALAGLGRISEAEAEFAELMAMSEAAGVDVGTAHLDLLTARAEFLLQQNHPDAQAAVDEALNAHVEVLGRDHPDTRHIAGLPGTMDSK